MSTIYNQIRTNMNPYGAYSYLSNTNKQGSTSSTTSASKSREINYYDVVKLQYTNGSNNSSSTSNSSGYLASVKKDGKALNEDIKELASSLNSGVWNRVTASSSEAEAVTASVNSKESVASLLEDTKINVEQVATTQKNTGAQLTAKDRALDSFNDYNKFVVNVGGKEHEFTFTVSATDTNKDVQQRMADKINKNDIGVTASVKLDAATGKSSLVIESKETGNASENNAPVFTISDRTGNAVRAADADNVSQTAKNAVYSVNGGEDIVSRSNNVDLGNGVTATLKKVTTSDATLSFKKDTSAGIEAVEELVKSFNKLLSTATDNKNNSGANRLLTELTGASKTYRASLEKIGVNVSSSGELSIDSTKLEKASQNGSLESYFKNSGGYSNYGFVSKIENISQKAANSPSSYNGTVSSTYSSNGTSTSYNQYSNYGTLFDLMF